MSIDVSQFLRGLNPLLSLARIEIPLPDHHATVLLNFFSLSLELSLAELVCLLRKKSSLFFFRHLCDSQSSLFLRGTSSWRGIFAWRLRFSKI